MHFVELISLLFYSFYWIISIDPIDFCILQLIFQISILFYSSLFVRLFIQTIGSMFASEQDLKKPNGPGSKSRFIYFQRLIQEFQDTEDISIFYFILWILIMNYRC